MGEYQDLAAQRAEYREASTGRRFMASTAELAGGALGTLLMHKLVPGMEAKLAGSTITSIVAVKGLWGLARVHTANRAMQVTDQAIDELQSERLKAINATPAEINANQR